MSGQHQNLYSDEVAREVHDIIHQAEEEEERLHPEQHRDDHQQPPMRNTRLGSDSSTGSADSQSEPSGLDKFKEALLMKK